MGESETDRLVRGHGVESLVTARNTMNIAGFFIIFAIGGSYCHDFSPPTPQDVYLKSYKPHLTWTSSSHYNTTTYTIQYSRDGREWVNVSGCVLIPNQECDFTATATKMYGATLRVQAQLGQAHSPWQPCNCTVQCVHTKSCSPEMVAKALPEYINVEIDRNRDDQSLKDEYGGHLSYRVFYRRKEKEKALSLDSESQVVHVQPVRAGEEVCVWAQYLIYSKPDGTRSQEQCFTIPLSDDAWDRYVAYVLVLVFAFLLVSALGCYCFMSRCHTHIKEFTRPVILAECIQFPPSSPLSHLIPTFESYDQVSLHKAEPDSSQICPASGTDSSQTCTGSETHFIQTCPSFETLSNQNCPASGTDRSQISAGFRTDSSQTGAGFRTNPSQTGAGVITDSSQTGAESGLWRGEGGFQDYEGSGFLSDKPLI